MAKKRKRASKKKSTRDIAAFLRERVVPAKSSRHGLVIGIESYRDERLNLRCARADAEAIYRLMIDPDCGMFPEGNVKLLLDAEATKENIWRALSGLRRSAGKNDTVWVYYAGHGAPEGSNLYWVTHDADVDDLYGTGLSSEEITRVLHDIRAERLLVLLDCCHAAATAIQKNPTRALLTAEKVFACYKGHGRITISSSDGKEKSVELGEVGHGAFTYFLEKGLRGEADHDDDGVVGAAELWEYLRGKVTDASARVGNPQTPVLVGEMTHGLPLTLNPVATERKKHVADAITRLVGLGEENLSTEEAEFCLDILRRGPRTAAEEDVAAEFDAVPAGKVRIGTFKRLVRAALREPESARLLGAMEGPRPPKAEGVGLIEKLAEEFVHEGKAAGGRNWREFVNFVRARVPDYEELAGTGELRDLLKRKVAKQKERASKALARAQAAEIVCAFVALILMIFAVLSPGHIQCLLALAFLSLSIVGSIVLFSALGSRPRRLFLVAEILFMVIVEPVARTRHGPAGGRGGARGQPDMPRPGSPRAV